MSAPKYADCFTAERLVRKQFTKQIISLFEVNVQGAVLYLGGKQVKEENTRWSILSLKPNFDLSSV